MGLSWCCGVLLASLLLHLDGISDVAIGWIRVDGVVSDAVWGSSIGLACTSPPRASGPSGCPDYEYGQRCQQQLSESLTFVGRDE